ncbi:hypothetical protein [Bradyrhizobium sp.]|uniref:hypothetical protein n=1 Tax=Bradyrhizobium sp. TaxID=376 RepID=UPI003C22631B
MTYRMYGALIASLGAAALMLAADETFAGSGAAPQVSTRRVSRPFAARPFRHHNRNDIGAFWPGEGDFGDAPSNGEPLVGAPQPPSGDIHYTYTYDVPWDWAHRLPPAVIPSDHPYVPSCPTETVKVPGRDGMERTVNVMRCY